MATNPFTIHNLPYGVISINGSNEPPRLAIAYEENAIDVRKLLAIEPDNFQDVNDLDGLTVSLNHVSKSAYPQADNYSDVDHHDPYDASPITTALSH